MSPVAFDGDIAIVGGGAAGLAAAIFAGERAAGTHARILVLEGARKPGAKILVSGGGRCNVTNERVGEDDYNGATKPVIRRVLKSFDERRTLAWMRDLGVELKLEPTGKYFPVSDRARTVLEALLARVRAVGVDLRTGTRVRRIEPIDEGFRLHHGDDSILTARRVIMATGGLSLPKSGSDGAGLQWMREMGHAVVPTTPALAPLVYTPGEESGVLGGLSGLTTDARLEVRDASGRRLYDFTGSLVYTHFGLSGPAPMNASRHVAQARLATPDNPPVVTLGHPDFATAEKANDWLLAQCSLHPKRSAPSLLEALFPARLAEVVAGGEDSRMAQLGRTARLRIARRIAACPLPVGGDRGYPFAETTAGGVDLREVDLRTMASRVIPRLFLCGEMLDVDGRIGGFNFQWAWATGWLAGRGAVDSLAEVSAAAAPPGQ